MLSLKQTKIKKVLLVHGYIRKQEKLLKLSNVIPASIYPIIFEYQLCVETWNKDLGHLFAKISDDGSCIEMESAGKEWKFAFGSHIVKQNDAFKWTLKIAKGVVDPNLIVGLLPNEDDLLNTKDNEPFMLMCKWMVRAYVFSVVGGTFLTSTSSNYTYADDKSFAKEGDTLQIDLNWNEGTLHFITNGRDWGNALVDDIRIEEDVKELRLGICLVESDENIKLLIDSDAF